MTLTDDFIASLLQILEPFRHRRGTAPLSQARSLTGKAARVAQVVPEATPFAAALWAALSDCLKNSGCRPPRQVPTVRFFVAACWFYALLTAPCCPTLFPLERVVYQAPPHLAFPRSPYHVESDASPWGGGAVLYHHSKPVEYLVVPWDAEVLSIFDAELGSCRWQVLWEFVTLLLCLLSWGSLATDSLLYIFGDNVSALQDAISLKGSGQMPGVAREIAWRCVRYG